MAEARVTGGCLCGGVRYEADHLPWGSGYCHCRMCQQSVGNVFALYAAFRRSGFRYTKGEPKRYRSSDIATRGFCDQCGSPLTFEYDHDAENLDVTVGSLDDPEQVRPTHHTGTESAVSWLKIDDGLPRKRTEESKGFQDAMTSRQSKA